MHLAFNFECCILNCNFTFDMICTWHERSNFATVVEVLLRIQFVKANTLFIHLKFQLHTSWNISNEISILNVPVSKEIEQNLYYEDAVNGFRTEERSRINKFLVISTSEYNYEILVKMNRYILYKLMSFKNICERSFV